MPLVRTHPSPNQSPHATQYGNDEIMSSGTTPPQTPYADRVQKGEVAMSITGYNQVHEVRFRGGWPGLFAGENQTKAVTRAIADLNAQGRCVVATALDRWSFWKRLGVLLLAGLTLGFVVRVQNVIVVSGPLP
jgi:hypothetical protein